MEPEEIIYEKIRNSTDLNEINLPKTDEYFNFLEHRHHVRTLWPEKKNLKGIILFIHGYCSHFNRPTHGYLGPFFQSHGYAYVGFDSQGHGFTTGDRALLPPIDDSVQTILEFIRVIYSSETSTDSYKIDRSYQLEQPPPLFLIGHSMGGSLALIASTELQEKESQLKYPFKGAIYLCPAIRVPSLPAPVRFLLDYILTPLMDGDPMPSWLAKDSDPNKTWSSEEYVKYVKFDHYPQNPNGLGWGGMIRFRTASLLLEMADTAAECIPEVNYPYIMFHDPLDAVVKVEGAQEMIENSHLVPKDNKSLVLIDQSGHDILINKLGYLSKEFLTWLKKQS